ncbi:glycosyl transferase [Endozoicomonas sp. 8E]|uniref:glycosyl transferase n=1 Tax=Endozoicomonas sp. 8E TaxID=3035692 RepID=UPI002938E8A4|nr:glycosyl transferase [Endozoicomonas sp. 8E]WOG28311.1 glycosyl transferase [Endozoicomonas sp. 8E]
MGDFYQNGTITNFHNLRVRSVEDMEQELQAFSRQRPMSLVLPSLFSELKGPALNNIVQELSQVGYLSEIVIGLDRANEKEFAYSRDFFAQLNQHHRILWQDGPGLREIDRLLESKGLAPKEAGKGRNVWYCYGYVLASAKSEAVALHDCDIVTYQRDLLARLLYPVANPAFSYDFCKGYYARVADNKLNGRVSRLLVTPLLRALKKILGPMDYLEYLDSFRYPLAGEFSMRTSVFNDIRIPSDWGLEIGVLSEVKRNYSNKRLCQVDIADVYDHKHQPLSEEDRNAGLSKMSHDIIKAVFRKLATNGVQFNTETFRTIKATYYRVALDFIESYYDDAMMNGLHVDRDTEERAVELFARNIMAAGQHFLENPMERPFIPSWNRVMSAVPDILERLYDAVEEDNA